MSRQKIIRVAPDVFPATFLSDLEHLLTRLGMVDPLGDGVQGKPLRPATLRQYRQWILRFASELVHSGVPISDIRSVADLVRPDHAKRGLRQMLSRTGNKPTKLIEAIASLLRNLGRILQVPGRDHAQLKVLAQKLSLKAPVGMTARNRERMRVLQSDDQTRRLLLLPERLFHAPPKGRHTPFTQGLAREDALAIAILLICPVRVKNLAEIRIDHHLQRPGDGRAFLVFVEEDTKTARPIEFELPKDVIKMIDRHLATRGPDLCPPGTPWLFPRRDGAGPVRPGQLAGRLSRRIRKETGLEMNAHLFRHFAVMLWLDANPGGYEVARQLLGHSAVSHTIAMYAGLEAKAATRLFADLVTSKKGRTP